MMYEDIVELKKKLYEELQQDKIIKEQSRKQSKCFWTWPWGHLYKGTQHFEESCQVCGKTRRWV
jgi:hypothetical protein